MLSQIEHLIQRARKTRRVPGRLAQNFRPHVIPEYRGAPLFTRAVRYPSGLRGLADFDGNP